MSKETGGPAFPSSISDDTLHVEGMTLRDYFAAKAMGGFCVTNPDDGSVSNWDYYLLARAAYKAADAMLKAREEE